MPIGKPGPVINWAVTREGSGKCLRVVGELDEQLIRAAGIPMKIRFLPKCLNNISLLTR